ncbi:hypothetical protein ACFVAF_04120 [Streptomyces sp. NPDC057596]|uniref:hypothetical protein n=1 Tax=Streptomyces sp. NPDC057596 TaxID=3346178 RepID=UPI0036755ED1
MGIFRKDPTRTPMGPSSGSSHCDDCGGGFDMYTLRDEVWFGPARARSNTVLCIPCLEVRLRRPITAADLYPEAIVNDPNSRQWPKTALYRRRAAGWTYRPY